MTNSEARQEALELIEIAETTIGAYLVSESEYPIETIAQIAELAPYTDDEGSYWDDGWKIQIVD